MRKTTYYLIAFLISSCLWQINAQTTHNLDWSMGISSADASLTIDAGDTVIWTFTDTAPHSVTSDTGSNETFDSGTLGAGSTYQYTFTEEGVNDYHCEVHPSMVGTITVNAALVAGSTCDAPIEITSLPYSTSDDTANYGDDYENGSSPCATYYMSGDDVIYSFTPLNDALVDISLTNISGTYSGIHVLDGCVDDNPSCVAFVGNSTSSDRLIEDLILTGGQTYYIVISTWATPQSITYDLDIVEITCPDPKEIYTSNVTPTSAEVYWMAGSDETEWELLYGETGFDPETEGMTVNDNDGTLGVELTDLTPQMQYDVYVKAVCGVDDESTWVGPHTFGDYNALEVTGGFNEDVIANGLGEASTTTTNLVDNDSYAYLSVDYQSSPSEDPAGFGLPLDGNLSEGPIDGLNFQMADYSSNNALRMDTAGESNGGTLTFDNSQTASNLYIMATSGSGASVLAGTITFEDNSTQDFSGIDVPDWYGGPANMTIISGLGRVNVTNGSAASNSSNPRIYQLEVNIDPSNYDKVISSVDLYKESGSGVINVFGASIQFAPDCPAPSDITLSNITSDSVEVTWTAGNTETEWEVLYGETGFDTETEGISVQDNDATLGETLNELAGNTTYDIYVKSICGVDDESIWTGPVTFTTDCNAINEFPYTENFNSVTTPNLPSCWSQLDENGDGDFWKTYTYYGVDNSQAVGLYTDYNSGNNDDYLISPQFTLTGNERLKFSMRVRSSGEPNDFEVLLSTDGENPEDFTEELVPLTEISNTSYEEYVINLDNYTGDVYISFHVPNGGLDGYYIYMDNFVIEEIPSCIEPTDLIVENITMDSAEVTWTAGGTETQWEVLYGDNGFDPETEGTTVSDDDGVLGVTLSDLDLDSTYEVYVRAICDENSISPWTGPVSFSTPYCVTNFSTGVEPITLVDFGDIENVTSASTAEDAQEYFLDMTTDLGQTYSYTITAEGNTNGTYTNLFTVFFDWNQDGEFNNEDERFEIGSIYNSTGEDGQQASAVITVPGDALVGETRMRVTKRYYTSVADACNTSGFGQAEDYTVNVVEVSCFNPSELVIENITTTTADVSWTSNGDETEWEIIYGAVGFDPETEGNTIVDNDELGETISDLTPEMEYDVYIKAVCGVDDESQWVGPESFMTPPTCPKPINLMVDSLTFTSADVSWEAGDLEDEWFVIYGEAGFDPETDGETVYVTGTPEETLTSLTPETDYEFYVVAICSVLDTSSLEGPVAFTTDYCESMPSSNDGTGFTTLELQSTVFASGGDITYEDFTDTPVEVTQGMMVSFEVDLNTGFGYDYNYNVWVDFNDNLEFEESELVVSGETEGNSNEVFDASFILPEDTMIGNHRLRLAVADSGQSTPNPCYNGSYGNTADFTINVIEPCETPTEVDIDNVTDSTAEVTWMDNAGVTEWEVLYGETGFDPASEGESVIDNNEELGVILSDLTPETTYDVYVRAICNETTTSEWTVVEMFTTLQEPCEAPTEVDIDNVTDSTAEVTWMDNAGVTEWEVLYGETGFDPTSEGESMMDNDGVLGVVLSDLTPETTYDVYVRAICDTDNMSEWTVVEMFTTLQEPCEAPTEVDIDNVTDSTAEVTWMDNAGVNEWEVLYGETGFDPLTEGESMMDNDGVLGVTLIGLDAETTYDVYVRAICDTENMSEWTAVESFTTDFLGVNTENFVGFNYYPNPVKNSINLESRLNIDKVSIYNLLGQEVLSRDLNEMSPSLDMSNLASGAYILRVQIGSQSKIIRVIKE